MDSNLLLGVTSAETKKNETTSREETSRDAIGLLASLSCCVLAEFPGCDSEEVYVRSMNRQQGTDWMYCVQVCRSIKFKKSN